LNLDLTVNPDFSQVEVDQEVTNLTRYDIFLPEKRAFFLENSEIFGGFGAANFIQPFYSRSIGLDKYGNKIPIIGGARLSGNVTKSTRIGIMNMQTADHGDYHAENFTAVSVHQNLFSRSVIKGYFLDRQSFQPDSLDQKDPLSKWGRNAGMEFDYSNLTGSFVATASYNQSFKPGITDKNKYVEASATYLGRHFSFQLDGLSVGTNYYTDMGYVQRISNYDALRDTSIRVGFTQFYGELNYKALPSKGGIGQHVIDLTSIVTLNPDNSFNERTHTLKYLISFKNTSSFSASATVDEVNLLYPINFTTTGKPLPAAHYNFTQGLLTYSSDIRKPFSLTVNAGGGYFYNGTIQTISGSINWRNQPHINLAIQAEYDKLQFPGQYSSAEIYLVSPKIEIDFSTKIFWTTYLQYNTQQNNYNINSRFQYRFRPMSDIYLVYTDNYFTNPNLKNKNRAVVFKMNYWLNL
ncbi:MAG: hypothetical protein JST96_16335, partial [Bacteroidetes bacterium]|nr:hypothetical protein [Bacteroidota bacterium]